MKGSHSDLETWHFLEDKDLETLNVGAATISAWDRDGTKHDYELCPAIVAMLKYAYERGLARKPLY